MNATVIEGIIAFSLVFTIAAVGLSLIVGYAGIFSAGQAALFGIGGFTYAILSSRGITNDLLLVLPIAAAVGAAVATVAALPALRLQGDYYLVASVGFQIVVLKLIVNWDSLSGGPPGLYAVPLPRLGSFIYYGKPEELLPTIAVITGIVILVSLWIVRSPYGRLMRGLADDEPAVRSGGASSAAVKLGVFVFGGALAAIAGVLYTSYLQVASPGDFSLGVSIGMLAMVLVGGAGSIWGPVVGAAILSSMPYWLGLTSLSNLSSNISNLIFGLVLIVVATFSPNGVAGVVRGVRRRRGAATQQRPPAVASTPEEAIR